MKRLTTISLVIFTFFALTFNPLAQEASSKQQLDGYNEKATNQQHQINNAASSGDFTTIDGPGPILVFMDDFEDGALTNWTITNDGGICDWINADFSTRVYTLPAAATGLGMAADADSCGSGTSVLSTATCDFVTDATQGPGYQTVMIEWDNDWRTIKAGDEAHVEFSLDGGTTWMSIVSWVGVDVRLTH